MNVSHLAKGLDADFEILLQACYLLNTSIISFSLGTIKGSQDFIWTPMAFCGNDSLTKTCLLAREEVPTRISPCVSPYPACLRGATFDCFIQFWRIRRLGVWVSLVTQMRLHSRESNVGFSNHSESAAGGMILI
jgi:hypothetical protein